MIWLQNINANIAIVLNYPSLANINVFVDL
jgi:hypothetical protein